MVQPRMHGGSLESAVISPRLRKQAQPQYLGLAKFDGRHERIGIVAFVGNDRLRAVHRFNQHRRLGNIRLLSASQGERQWIAQRIGDHVDLGAPATARAPQ